MRLIEPNKLSDVFSSDGKSIIGRPSEEKNKQLKKLTLFSIAEENGDHFDLFLHDYLKSVPNSSAQSIYLLQKI